MCAAKGGLHDEASTKSDFLSIFVGEVYGIISRMTDESARGHRELADAMNSTGVPDEEIQSKSQLWPVSKKCFLTTVSGAHTLPKSCSAMWRRTLKTTTPPPPPPPPDSLNATTAGGHRSSCLDDHNTLLYNYPLEFCPKLPRAASSVFFERCGFPDLLTLRDLAHKRLSIVDVMLDKTNKFSKKFLRIKDNVFFCWKTSTIFKTLSSILEEEIKNFTFEAFICTYLDNYIGTKKCVAVYSELWLAEYEYVGANIDTLLGRRYSELDKHLNKTNTRLFSENVILVAHQVCRIMTRFGELGLAFFDAKLDNFCVNPSTMEVKCIDVEHVIPFSFGSPKYECEGFAQMAPEMTLKYSGEIGVFTNTWGVAYCLKMMGQAMKHNGSSKRERGFLDHFQATITNILKDPSIRRTTRLEDLAHLIVCYHFETKEAGCREEEEKEDDELSLLYLE